MRYRHPAILALVAALAVSCLDPADPGLAAGRWRVSEFWSGDSVTCSIVSETLTVTEASGQLSGQMTGGGGLCINYGLPFPSKPFGPISQGRVDRDQVNFDVASQFSYHGQISFDHMSGKLAGVVTLGPPASRLVQVTGTWFARRS